MLLIRKKIIVILLLLFTLFSCSLFETREPENPEGDATIFIPPTTPNIVIENFLEAFNKKSIENYYACFSRYNFDFSPTNEVLVRYSSIFQEWNINSERQYFLSLTTNLQNEAKPNLIFTDAEFVSLSNDSAVFVANYFINCIFLDINISSKYTGRINLTIKNEKNGEWAITNWKDFRNNDTNNTWSYLKASFSN